MTEIFTIATRPPTQSVDISDEVSAIVARSDPASGLCHIEAAILGPSEMLAVDRGERVSGAWRRAMRLEFDGPRRRRIPL